MTELKVTIIHYKKGVSKDLKARAFILDEPDGIIHSNLIQPKREQKLTKKRFEQLLTKTAQPISEQKHDQEETRTSESHPSDGYSGKCKSQG